MNPEDFDVLPEFYCDDDGFWFFVPQRFLWDSFVKGVDLDEEESNPEN